MLRKRTDTLKLGSQPKPWNNQRSSANFFSCFFLPRILLRGEIRESEGKKGGKEDDGKKGKRDLLERHSRFWL